MCGSHHEARRRRCDGLGVLCEWHYRCLCFILNSRHTLPAWLPQHSAATRHPIWFALSRNIIYFSTGQWPNTPPGCVSAIWLRMGWSASSDNLTSTITLPQPKWDGLGWVGPQSEGKATNKCPANVGTPSRLLEKHSRWSWLLEYFLWISLRNGFLLATLP